jgi:Fic family protein
MADWDVDGPQLRSNLERVLEDVVTSANRRSNFTATLIKRWHREIMAGLEAPRPRFIGRFRGEPGLEGEPIYVGLHAGVTAALVVGEVDKFIRRLQTVLKRLDKLSPPGKELDADGLQAVVELAAWVHSEWVRIHPFSNGNGRIARILTNGVLMRYGLPPVLRLRPRPQSPYSHAGAEGMIGNSKPMAALLRRLLLNVEN